MDPNKLTEKHIKQELRNTFMGVVGKSNSTWMELCNKYWASNSRKMILH